MTQLSSEPKFPCRRGNEIGHLDTVTFEFVPDSPITVVFDAVQGRIDSMSNERVCPGCGHDYEYSHVYADKPNPCSKIIRVVEVTEAQRAAIHADFRDEAGVERCGHTCTFPPTAASGEREGLSVHANKCCLFDTADHDRCGVRCVYCPTCCETAPGKEQVADAPQAVA